MNDISLEQIRERIRELEAEDGRLHPPPCPIEARRREKAEAERQRQERLNVMAATHARVKDENAENTEGWKRLIDCRVDFVWTDRLIV